MATVATTRELLAEALAEIARGDAKLAVIAEARPAEMSNLTPEQRQRLYHAAHHRPVEELIRVYRELFPRRGLT
jgi:hypothetical protein